MNWRVLFWWRPPCLLRRVIVNAVDDSALEGVLWKSRGAWLVLRDVMLMEPGNPQRTAVDGEVVIHRSRVSFIQVLP